MQLTEKRTASDMRLGCTVMTVLTLVLLFFAWRIYANGVFSLGSCSGDRHPTLCELGRWLLSLLPAQSRHIFMTGVMLVLAGLFGWLAVLAFKEGERIEVAEGDDGKGLM